MTNRKVLTIAALLSYALGTCQLAAAQDDRSPEPENQAGQSIPVDPALAPQVYKPKGKIIVPESSVARAEDAGLRVHTNHVIFVPDGAPTSSPTPTTYYFAETPASLGCVYGVGPTYAGCNPTTGGTKHPSGGWGAIAIVDAYDNPNASSDLAFFSTFYGLPTATFSKVYANTSFGTLNGMTASCGGTPAASTSWGVEEDLDIEWAHAMAPSARIILVEACSNSYTDMLFAEQVAGIQVDIYGGGEITNSWGSAEFSTEVGAYDVSSRNCSEPIRTTRRPERRRISPSMQTQQAA